MAAPESAVLPALLAEAVERSHVGISSNPAADREARAAAAKRCARHWRSTRCRV